MSRIIKSSPTGSRRRALTPEERDDWRAVARSARALPGRGLEETVSPVAEPSPPPDAASSAVSRSKVATPARPTARPAPPTRQAEIDPRLLRALKRGRRPLEARLDLHGHTQATAAPALTRFLAEARGRGLRHVLVVTGKGLPRLAVSHVEEEPVRARGVLRRLVPLWLASPPLVDWVAGHAPAHPRDGGEGAFYVQLRVARERG